MPDIKLTGKPMQQRIADRLKNSGGDFPADVHVVKGSGPLRTHTNIHNSGTAHSSSTRTPNANDTSARDRGEFAKPPSARGGR